MIAKQKLRRSIWAFVALCALAAAASVILVDPIVELFGTPDDYGDYSIDLSGFGIGLAIFTGLPALFAGLAYARGWIGPIATAVAAAITPASATLAIWAYVDDLNSDDPSSTAGIAFVVLPFYAFVATALLITVAAAARAIRASRRARGAARGPTRPAGRP